MKEVGGTVRLTAVGIGVLAVLGLLILLVLLVVAVGILALVVGTVLIIILIVIHSTWYLLKIGYRAIIAPGRNNILL